ncbi:MAG: carboxypeptidase-like regulatory domain-containing protein [Bacteroidota bacterium]
MRIAHCFVLCFFSILNGLHSQQDFVRGRVLDSETGEPIIFATIRIKDKAIGVISNRDGDFRIPVKFRQMGDTLTISCMGYQKRDLAIRRFSPTDVNIIRLQPGVLELYEAVVTAPKKRKMSARRIVGKAVRAIPKNYPKHTFSTTGYYRDYQFDHGEYVNLNEAILEVFDNGFDEIHTSATEVRIYDYKQNTQFKRDTLADDQYSYRDGIKVIDNAFLPAYGGNEFVILRVHDAIRNYQINSFDFVNNMEKGDLLENHSFKKDNDVYSEQERLYVIDCKKIGQDYTAVGKLFIAKSDFGIHRIEYAVYDARKKNDNPILQAKGIRGNLVFEVGTEYKRGPDNILYLNYISFHNTFQLAIPPKFVVKEVGALFKEKALRILFNKPLHKTSNADKKKNYKIHYRNKRLRFADVQIVKDSIAMLTLDVEPKDWNTMVEELDGLDRRGTEMNSILKVEIEDVIDVHGNVVNEWTSKEYNQFREYFVQKDKFFIQIPSDIRFMDKRRPIFENQPISQPKNFADYWMNTPLKKLEN